MECPVESEVESALISTGLSSRDETVVVATAAEDMVASLESDIPSGAGFTNRISRGQGEEVRRSIKLLTRMQRMCDDRQHVHHEDVNCQYFITAKVDWCALLQALFRQCELSLALKVQ